VSAVERLRLRLVEGLRAEGVPVAMLGAPGSHTERATRVFARLRGWDTLLVRCGSMSAVLDRVLEGECAFGVLPIHNTHSGPVRPAIEALARSGLPILERHALRVHHALLVRSPDQTLSSIREVASHPHALVQCRPFLRRRLPGRDLRACGDTATAARSLAEGRLGSNTAVLASRRAARLHGLHVLVEDCLQGQSRTTFVLVAGESPWAREDR